MISSVFMALNHIMAIGRKGIEYDTKLKDIAPKPKNEKDKKDD